MHEFTRCFLLDVQIISNLQDYLIQPFQMGRLRHRERRVIVSNQMQTGGTSKNKAQLPAHFSHVRWHPFDGMEKRTGLMGNERVLEGKG